MKANIFTNELAKTSSVFGRKKSVDVVFDGDGAATNGTTIKLPAIDLNADVTEEQAAIMRGYVDHEAGHVRHTDFDVLKRNKHKLEGNKLLHSCANALEDVWLESKVREEYPGSEYNLRATSEAVNKEFIASVPKDDARLGDPVFIGPVSITWAGRESYGGDTNEQCLNMIDHGIADMAREFAERVLDCKNSGEVFELAEELEARIRRERDDETGESDGSDGEDGEADSEMDDEEWRGLQPDVDGTDKPEGSDVSEGDKPDDGDGDGDATTGGVAVDDVYDEFGTEVALKQIKRDLASGGFGTYRVMSTEHDRWWHRNDERTKWGKKKRANLGHHIMGKYDAVHYDRVLERMSGTINLLRRKLERALLAKQTRDWDVAKEHGRLDTKRLTAAVAGRTTVFKTRTDRVDMDTAMTLLIDLSGSMSGSRIHTARECAIAIAEAVDRTGVKYEMLGFVNDFIGDIPDDEFQERVHDAMRGDWGRIQPLNMAVFKQFDERLYEAKGSIASMIELAIGDNTDGEALQLAHQRLADRPEKRKVMIVLSDGQPCAWGHGTGKLDSHLKRTVKEISEAGTEVVGIGIQTDSVAEFYPNSVVVHRLRDLEGEVMGQLSKILLGERVVLDHTKIDHAV